MSASRKGQASLVDVLLLTFAVSLILVAGIYGNTRYVEAQVIREENVEAATIMISLLNDDREVMMGGGGHKVSVAEMLDIYYCSDQDPLDNATVSWEINESLKKLVSDKHIYIFYARHGGDEIVLYNRQASVCARHLAIKRSDLILTCGDFDTEPLVIIWPEWKTLPDMNNCQDLESFG